MKTRLKILQSHVAGRCKMFSNAQQCSTMLSNAKQYSAMHSNAQQCSAMLSNATNTQKIQEASNIRKQFLELPPATPGS